ncbi:hypothetical protein OIU84_013211 [Salix udensis]|uniref:Uncharacterized protein n=1 Tax=Salix udensis TaxID=889485 RepID=A0AAD6NUG8_9ROSI|nr:hypothetical protein OIU84_013211 [Salix udensis]
MESFSYAGISSAFPVLIIIRRDSKANPTLSSLIPPICPSLPPRRPSDAARRSTSSSSSSGRIKVSQTNRTNLRSDSNNDSRELSRIAITDHQKSNDNKALVQATSGNVMLLGPLGNLRQSGNGDFAGNNSPNATVKTVDHRHKKLQEAALSSRPRNCYSKLGSNSVMGNIVRQPGGEFRQGLGLITSMDPEVLKNKGNERYRQGRYEEALVFKLLSSAKKLSGSITLIKEPITAWQQYISGWEKQRKLCITTNSQAPILTPRKLLELRHFKRHLNRCTEARKLKEWNRLLSETEFSISSGADSVPQVYAMQAEALLRLHRHQEACTAYQKGPGFSADFYTKLFGLTIASYILMIGAQVYMAVGRLVKSFAIIYQ